MPKHKVSCTLWPKTLSRQEFGMLIARSETRYFQFLILLSLFGSTSETWNRHIDIGDCKTGMVFSSLTSHVPNPGTLLDRPRVWHRRGHDTILAGLIRQTAWIAEALWFRHVTLITSEYFSISVLHVYSNRIFRDYFISILTISTSKYSHILKKTTEGRIKNAWYQSTSSCHVTTFLFFHSLARQQSFISLMTFSWKTPCTSSKDQWTYSQTCI